jgi:hypothetical protein
MQYVAELTHLTVNGVPNSRALEKHMIVNQGFAGIEFNDQSAVRFFLSYPNVLKQYSFFFHQRT